MTDKLEEFNKWSDEAKKAFSDYTTSCSKDESYALRSIETILKTNQHIQNEIEDENEKRLAAIRILVARASGNNQHTSASDWKDSIEETANTIIDDCPIITSYPNENNPEKLYYWNGHYYKCETNEFPFLRSRILDILERDAVINTRKAIVDRIKARTLDNKGRFHRDKHLIALENGTFDSLTLEVENPPDPERIVLNYIPVKYDPNVGYNDWQKFIDGWVEEEDYRDTLQEFIGYFWVREQPAKRLLYLTGAHDSGRSKFCYAINNMLGGSKYNNYSSLGPMQIGGRFNTALLYNKLANIRSDVEVIRKATDLSLIKPLSGGDTLTAEFKGITPFQMLNHAKTIWTGNGAPNVGQEYLSDDAWVLRWLPIDFPFKFVPESKLKEDDDRLKLAIPDDMLSRTLISSHMKTQIFNWSIEGLKRLRSRKWVFSYKPNLKDIRHWFESGIHYNNVEMFLKSRTTINVISSISKALLYREAEKWFRECKLPIDSYEVFCKKVQNNRVYEVATTNPLNTKTREQIPSWRGITWR